MVDCLNVKGALHLGIAQRHCHSRLIVREHLRARQHPCIGLDLTDELRETANTWKRPTGLYRMLTSKQVDGPEDSSALIEL